MSRTVTQDQEADEASSQWDRTAFWYPDTPGDVALLGVILVLIALHMGEWFGIPTNGQVLFGWIPVHAGYHLLLSVAHIAVLYVVYRRWPSPTVSSDSTSSHHP